MTKNKIICSKKRTIHKGDFIILPKKANLGIKGFAEVIATRRTYGETELKIRLTGKKKVERFMFASTPGICKVDETATLRGMNI